MRHKNASDVSAQYVNLPLLHNFQTNYSWLYKQKKTPCLWTSSEWPINTAHSTPDWDFSSSLYDRLELQRYLWLQTYKPRATDQAAVFDAWVRAIVHSLLPTIYWYFQAAAYGKHEITVCQKYCNTVLLTEGFVVKPWLLVWIRYSDKSHYVWSTLHIHILHFGGVIRTSSCNQPHQKSKVFITGTT